MENSPTSLRKRKRKTENLVTEESKKEGPWPWLTQEIVSQISLPLSFVDRTNANRAIPTWNSAMRTAPCMPYFLTFEGENNERFNFFDPIRKKKSRVQDFIKKDLEFFFSNARLLWSNHGWLLVDRNYMKQRDYNSSSLVFYNPLSDSIIKLPPIKLPNKSKGFNFCFSAPPTCSQCIVIAGEFTVHRVRIILCQRGQNKWKDIKIKRMENNINSFQSEFASSVFYHGKFYWLAHDSKLGIFDPVRESWAVQHIAGTNNRCSSEMTSDFLVNSGNDLYRVWWSDESKTVVVYKLHETSNYKWEKTQSLGDQCFFVAFRSVCLSIPALKGMRNKVFIPMKNPKSNGFVYFDTHNDRLVYPSRKSCCYPYMHACWVQPKYSYYTCDELNWLKN